MMLFWPCRGYRCRLWASLARLSMVAIEDQRQNRRGKNVEDDDVDVWVSLDQGKHGYPLLRRRGFFFPSGEP
jgi:hypothetical protein